MTFGQKAINYFTRLKAPSYLIDGITLLNPYVSETARGLVKIFYQKFFNDNDKRIFILGINPGRFGGGLTGISFTDPVALKNHCLIPNEISSQEELSSKFIYKSITKFGGVEKFFSKFYLSALYPFALINDGKNYNFYDSKGIFNLLKDGIIQSLKEQIKFGADETVICLGKKNSIYLKEINEEVKLFKEMIVLEHPRYIMQYKMKRLDGYLDEYVNTFNKLSR